jgi:hypothetical protein
LEGRAGLLCESCIEGFVKQNDKCIPCTGAAWDKLAVRSAIKTAMTFLLCGKLVEKAATRTYTSTTAFATVVFTLQTVALAASDSYGTLLQSEWPEVSDFFDFVQTVLNPDRETPEKCLFAPSLSSKLAVESVLPPGFAMGVLAAICIPWYFCRFSCGWRPFCNAKRACIDLAKGKQQRRKLTVKWDGEPVLDGTYVLIAQNRAAIPAGTKRSVSLAGHDPSLVWLSRSSVGGPHPDHYKWLSAIELRRILRFGNTPTTGKEDQPTLLQMLHFGIGCDDNLFDSEKMPETFEVQQILHSIMLILVYFYAPVSRSLEQFMLCRTVGGSTDPITDKEILYLKQDMAYPCRGGEHQPVVIVATTMWILYAICFPLVMACVIYRDKVRSKAMRRDGEAEQTADFWNSTTPHAEKFWMPLVAHLQPEFWWCFPSSPFRPLNPIIQL